MNTRAIESVREGVRPASADGVKNFLRANRSVLILVGLAIALSILTEGTFLSPRNLTNLTRQVSINGILAVGMTYVILIRGIDLSVGSVVALAGVVAGVLQVNLGLAQWTGPSAVFGAALSFVAAIAVGAVCGTFNGWMITRHRIAPFIVTLGTMVIARGLALIFAKGAAIAPLGDSFNFLGQGYIPPLISSLILGLSGAAMIMMILFKPEKTLNHWISAAMVLLGTGLALYTFQNYRGLPIPVVILGVFAILGTILLQKTRLGRFVFAIGGNPDAAWLAGVPIRSINFGIYICLGALAGLSGAILSARLNGSLPTAGELFELDAIAAVVIGGTSLMGGIGTVRGSILGAFFIGALNNGMSLMDVTEFYQKVIKGVIIILAVWLDMKNSKQSRA